MINVTCRLITGALDRRCHSAGNYGRHALNVMQPLKPLVNISGHFLTSRPASRVLPVIYTA